MANDIFKSDHFAIEVISSGEFLNDDPSFLGDTFTVQTYTIRLNRNALNEFWGAVTRDRSDFLTREEWDAYRDRQGKRMKDFEAKIADALQINLSLDGSFCVSKVVSEIFTVVRIRKNQATA